MFSLKLLSKSSLGMLCLDSALSEQNAMAQLKQEIDAISTRNNWTI